MPTTANPNNNIHPTSIINELFNTNMQQMEEMAFVEMEHCGIVYAIMTLKTSPNRQTSPFDCQS